MTIRVLWATPRTVSTAFERMMIERGDLLVLDEPDAHLDHAGSDAVAGAVRKIRARGGAAVVMAHRPAAIATCDTLLVLGGGRVRRIGPREEVLREMVQNHVQIAGVA
jgi:ATP-binding cassette subfamily C protein